MTAYPDLETKLPDLAAIAQAAISNESYREQLFRMLLPGSKRAQARYNSYRALILLTESHPELLLSKWDQLVEMLTNSNKDIIFIAVNLIANLAGLVNDSSFEKIIDQFYSLLADESIVVAMHTAGVSGKIALAKPDLRERITYRLLEIDQVRKDQGNTELVKAYIISALDEYFEVSSEQPEILQFVGRQRNSTSPKTRKAAAAFLKRHPMA